MSAYVYHALGTVYHTRNCGPSNAYDGLPRLAVSKTHVPEGRRKCTFCRRKEQRESEQ